MVLDNVKNFFKDINLPKWVILDLIIVILFSIFVRIQGLGYSNFQGDEVNTVDMLYKANNGFWDYLFSQKKGPGQYLINWLNIGIFGYHSEFWIRLPYLIAGIAGLFTSYRLTKRIFDKETALIAVSIMSVNGLFIAFSRITQYQSLMFCFLPVAVLLFIKALSDKKIINKYLISSALVIAALCLVHYDTASILPFFIVSYVAKAFREKSYKNNLLSALIFFSFVIIPVISYYIPFANHQEFNAGTSGYLESRLFGGSYEDSTENPLNLFMPGTANAVKLLTMYIPGYFLITFFLLGFIGILSFYRNIEEKLIKYGYMALVIALAAVSYFSLFPIKPRLSSLLVIALGLSISSIVTFSKKIKWYEAGLIVWFLGAYSFYLYVMRDARTHVYVSMIPLFPLAASGIIYLCRCLKDKVLKEVYFSVLVLALFFTSGINYMIFVDKTPEYPWSTKHFLGYEIYKIEPKINKKIEGVFGFNNYRGWEQIGDLYKQGCLKGTLNSNEKNLLTYFYLGFDQKQGDSIGLNTNSDNIVLVEGPHSWYYVNREGLPENYVLLETIYSEGIPVTYVYGDKEIYTEGKLLCE